MSLDTSQLLALQKKVETAKQEIAQLNGELQGVMKQLKTEEKLDNVHEVKTKIAELETDLQTIDDKIETNTKKLEAEIEIIGEEE
jgi:predicted  nucleic acid-binding Zn-ribbon protein